VFSSGDRGIRFRAGRQLLKNLNKINFKNGIEFMTNRIFNNRKKELIFQGIFCRWFI